MKIPAPTQLQTLRSIRKPMPRPSRPITPAKVKLARRRTKRVDE